MARRVESRYQDFEAWRERESSALHSDVEDSLLGVEAESLDLAGRLARDPDVAAALTGPSTARRRAAFATLRRAIEGSSADPALGVLVLDAEGGFVAWAGWVPLLAVEPVQPATDDPPTILLDSRMYRTLATTVPVEGTAGRVTVLRPLGSRFAEFGEPSWAESMSERLSDAGATVSIDLGGVDRPAIDQGEPPSRLTLADGRTIGVVDIDLPGHLEVARAAEVERIDVRRAVLALGILALALLVGYRLMTGRRPRWLRALGVTVVLVAIRWLLLTWHLPGALVEGDFFRVDLYSSNLGLDLPFAGDDADPLASPTRFTPFVSLGDLLLTVFFLLVDLLLLAHLFLPPLRVRGLASLGGLFRSAEDLPLLDESTRQRLVGRPLGRWLLRLTLLGSPLAALLGSSAFSLYRRLVQSMVFDSRIGFADPYTLVPGQAEATIYVALLAWTLCLLIAQGLLVLVSVRILKNLLRSRRLAWIATAVVFLAATPFDWPVASPEGQFLLEIECLALLFVALFVLKGMNAYRVTVRVVAFSAVLTLVAHESIQVEFQAQRVREATSAAEILPHREFHDFRTRENARSFAREAAERLAAMAEPIGPETAVALWATSYLAREGTDCHVLVTDAAGQIVSELAINMPPLSWYGEYLIPTPIAPGEAEVRQERGQGAGGRTDFFIAGAGVERPDVGTIVLVVPDSASEFYRRRTLPRLSVAQPTSTGLLTTPYHSEYVGIDLVRTTDPVLPITKKISPAVSEAFEAGRQGPLEQEESIFGQRRINVYVARTDDDGQRTGYYSVGFQPATGRERFYHFLILFILMCLATVLTVGFFHLYARLDPTGPEPVRRPVRFGLEARIVASFVFVAIVPTLMIGVFAHHRASARIRQQTEADIERAMALVDQRLDRLELARAPVPGAFLVSDLQPRLERLAEEIGQVVLVYRDDRLVGTNQEFLYQTERVGPRLPGAIYDDVILAGRRSLFREIEIGGTPHLVGYRPILTTDGEVVGAIAIPALYRQKDIERQSVDSSSMIFSIFFCMIVAMIVLALVIARWIARPLQVLMDGTRRVAGGDLDFELPPRSDDEIGELIESFNRMTRELLVSRDRLLRAERDAAWREMAKQIAHEIKNPLTPMKLAAQNLRRAYERDADGFEKILHDGVRMIVKQVDTLSRIATEFSSFAKFPTRHLDDVSMREVVEGALSVFCPPTEDRIGLSVDVVRDLEAADFTLRLDRDEMTRVFINLIKNAIQAMEEAGGVLTVTVARAPFGQVFDREAHDRLEGEVDAFGPADDVALVTIADTGPGMDAETRGRVFEPNFSTKSAGTGLGLAICRRSVTEMKGLIGLTTSPGTGCRFVVVLPISAEGVITRVRAIGGEGS